MKEDLRDEAISTGHKALSIIDSHRLYETNEGAILRGEFSGHIARLQGVPISRSPIFSLLGAYLSGAALGAVLGAQVQIQSANIHGPILTDLRYGGAALGALLGIGLFRSLFSLYPVLGIIVGFLNLGVLYYILTATDFRIGLTVLAMILFIPVMGLLYVLSKFKGRA
jgi:hypothetical protein